MVQVEKRLMWHPRHSNKFIVGGNSQIILYEWASTFPEIRQVTSQQDLHHMKCFAWSPDPTFEDLIAVGMSTGKVDLMRLEASKHARQSNVLSHGPIVSLPARNSRACNALAFCNVDPNYLAVGLDKVRGDCSLVIWDISSTSPLLSLSSESGSHDPAARTLPSRPQPQIPRVDNYPRPDQRVLQQHAPTEVVSSLSFLPTSTHLLLASISHRWFRLFDLRASSSSVVNVASKVNVIATDPYDAHRIACCGDGVITVWDSRKLVQPLMSFSERDASADGSQLRPTAGYANVEFSTTRRGCLASLERDAGYVRFWDLMEAKPYTSEQSAGHGYLADNDRTWKDANKLARRSWAANLPWPTGNQQQHSPKEKDTISNDLTHSLLISDTRRTKLFSRPLASFALVPDPNNPHPLTSKVVVVNREGDLEINAVYDTPKQANWSPRGDLVIGAGVALKVIQGYHDKEHEEGVVMEAPRAPLSHVYNADTFSIREQSLRFGDSHSRNGSLRRGRTEASKGSSLPLLFGRDDDVFPALSGSNTAAPTGLSVTRPGKGRTYSPASLRKYKGPDQSDSVRARNKRSLSRTDTVPAGLDEISPDAVELETSDQDRHGNPNLAHKPPGAQSRGVSHVVEDDISMVIRRRTLAGYGLSQPRHNIYVTQNHSADSGSHPPIQPLSELWAWLSYSQEFLCSPTPRLHGYDFSYQGIMGIWEGVIPMYNRPDSEEVDEISATFQRSLLLEPTPVGRSMHSSFSKTLDPATDRYPSSVNAPVEDLDDWQDALTELTARIGPDRTPWKSSTSISKPLQRQLALQLCGWSMREEDLLATIKRWEKEGKTSRAACWLIFTKNYSKAVDLLMRSEDEAHRMMSGTVAALIPQGSTTPPQRSFELREHCERLIVRLQDPYFRVMLTHLAIGDWSEVLQEDVLPFRERLAIVFQFLDDKAVSAYLRRMTERACQQGDIDALILTGLTKPGMDILQAYVDHTGDIQTATILSSYVCPHKLVYPKAERWLKMYRDLLDGFKLHHHRVGFDIERGQILGDAIQSGEMPPVEWVPKQILIRCHYCNKPISKFGGPLVARQTGKPSACPHCNRSLPRCSVCLLTLAILYDAAREAELEYSHYKDTIDDAIVICQTCRHGGHASHIHQWFFGEDGGRNHDVCAVADCNCRCASEF